MDRTKMLEQAEAQLTRRQAALAATLEEIDYLEKNKDKFKTPEEIVSYGHAVGALKTRRDRQHNLCNASKALVTALTKTK